MSKEFNTDLTKLQVGDMVAMDVNSRWGVILNRFDLFHVERITATQVITKNGLKFRKSDGKKIGGNYSEYAFIPTDEQLEAERAFRKEAKRKFEARKWLEENIIKNFKSLSVEQIETIKAAYESTLTEQK